MDIDNFTGGCNCGAVRYNLSNPPLFVHACHCTKCQKRTGSAFGITTIVLENDIEITVGKLEPERISEKRTAFVCSSCKESIYVTATNHPATALLSSRTSDDLRVLEINAHIWTSDKHPWLELPNHVLKFDERYDRNETWPKESMDRLNQALDKWSREP